MFRPVTSKVNFPQIEGDILRFWKERGIFKKSLEARQTSPQFVFYEGPPTANGSPGTHHVLARVFKDVFARYKTMKGYYVPRKAGWDTHGLPVELEVEKELGLSSKSQIEDFGVARFNAHCRESVFRYLREWEEMTGRIGFWLDMEHPYVTLDNDYIESGWWILKQLWDKSLIYQGYRVAPHCPRCGTSLSSHEVALGYQEADDPSVYIKFKFDLSRSPVAPGLFSSPVPAFFLAWTTTPWTLPANTALAVAAEAEYAVVGVDDEYLILASALIEQAGLCDCRVRATVPGAELVGLHYEPLYEIPIGYGEGDEPAYRLIEGDFVSLGEGTGIVHIAPAYGEIDFEVGEKEGLPLVHTIDLDGRVKDMPGGLTPGRRRAVLEGLEVVTISEAKTPDTPGRGKFVKEADKDIMADLSNRGLLYRSECLRHSYPFCWRCDTPLLYYAKPTWYIRTTAVKERLMAHNARINWYPEHIKNGRFGDWLENNVDWAFSRERYWGTPLPVWKCDGCGHLECIGSVDELKKLAHHEAMEREGHSLEECLRDLHRPFVDDIVLRCPRSESTTPHAADTMRRLPEVLDAWFDSGAMPVAQWHYPFENQSLFRQNFPADFICEAVDQTRGWFYTLHALSTLLFDQNSYENVICLGHILDVKGEKMSKAKGNVVDPRTPLDSYGADALRWHLFTSSPAGNVRRFSPEMVAEAVSKFLRPLWNTYSFFVIYANIDHFDPALAATTYRSQLDNWLLSELNQLISQVTEGMENYNPTEAGRRIEQFVDDLSNWYVRRSRRRFWKSENDADKQAAYLTLYYCLVSLTKLLAPFTPFVAEEVYRNLVYTHYTDVPESVHLADFPVADQTKINLQLAADTRAAMKVSSLGRAARSQAGIKVRQPLAEVRIGVRSKEEREGIQRLASQVLEELNVKNMEFVPSGTELDKSSYAVVSEGDYLVAVDTRLSPELLAEGMAREVVHRLQTMRRSAGFDIADYINTYYQGDTSLCQVMTDFSSYIKLETLSHQLIERASEEGAYTERHRINGMEVVLGVKRSGL